MDVVGGVIMKTLCYYISRDDKFEEFEEVLEIVENAIPCFIEMVDVEMNFVEVTIKCREEDVTFVETSFAPFV